MENAPKALLIAGAVLIVIFIISVALLIVNSISGITENSKITSESISAQMFNSQFTSYFSNTATGAQAKALIDRIIQNNTSVNSSTFSPDSHHIWLNYYPTNRINIPDKITHQWKTSGLKTIYNKISNTAKYSIYATKCGSYPDGYHNGYIICISIMKIN